MARCSLRLGPRWPVPLQTRLSSELAQGVQEQARCASCAVCTRACVRRHDACMDVRPSSELPEEVQLQAGCACCAVCTVQESSNWELETFCVSEKASLRNLNMRLIRRMNCEIQLRTCLLASFICYHPVCLKTIAPAMLLSLGQSAVRALLVRSWSWSASRQATTEIVPLMIWIGPSKDSVC